MGETDLITGNLGGALWTYGRFTANTVGLVSPDGLWTFVYDGILGDTTWGALVWDALLSNDGKVLVEAALSTDGVTYGAFQPMTFANSTPAGVGRYLKVRARLVSATTGESPVLRDLTVGTAGYAPPTIPYYWDITAGADIAGNWPDIIQLKPAFRHSPHDFSTAPAYAWSVVSGPGTVTFSDPAALRPTAQFSVKGDYVLRLTATLDGVTQTDDVSVSLTPYNRAPYANAGYTTFRADVPPEIWLWGEIRDDGLPVDAPVTAQWSKLFGPGDVSFTDPTSASTKASFSAPGVYVLQLTATDGELTSSDVTTVWLGYSCIPVAPSGLMSWWQASGNGDDHVGGNQAFTERGTDYAEGKLGGAFRFDGVNDRVRIFSAPSLDVGPGDGFTLELWANPDTSRTATLIEYSTGAQRGFSLRQTGTSLSVDFKDRNGTSHVLGVTNGLPIGTWTHVTASYDRASGEARLYTNGQLQVTAQIGSFPLATGYDLNFGGQANAVESYDGLLDEISLYNRALYADELSVIVNHPAGKRPPVANVAPIVDVGPAVYGATANTAIALNASVTDDGQPIDGVLTSRWSKVSGPGVVTFGNETTPQTTVSFSEGGVYTLKLLADDGGFCTAGLLEVRVGALYKYDTGLEVAAWWTGNDTDLDEVHKRKLERINGVSYAAGEAASGFVFDGVNDYGRVAASSVTNIGASAAGMTIEFWAKPADYRYGALVSWGTPGVQAGVEVWQHDGGPTLRVPIIDVNGVNHEIAATNVFAPGVWVHVAVTYDRITGMARLYKNGVLVAESNLGIFQPGTTRQMFFGRTRDGNNAYNGVLDEVTLYTRPLSLAQVQAIYQGDTTGKVTLDNNLPPQINAGPDQLDVAMDAVVSLAGVVTDDGRPAGHALSISWSKIEGPGTVSFANPNAAATTATFSAAGTYVLQLSANDGLNQGTPDTMVVRVGITGSVDPDGSLAAWWPANGEVHEVVRGNHDVEFLPRGPAFAPGEVGQGFTFNGSDHYGRVPAHADLDIGASAAGMTIEFWAKPADYRYASLVSWGTPGVQPGVEVWQHDGGPTLRVPIIDVNGVNHEIAATNVFAPGVWVHVAVTYDRITGMARLYKNGVLVAESNLGIFQPGTTRQMFFGRTRDGNNAYNGVLDEVSLYTKPLSLPEVQALYNAGVNGKAPLDDNLPPVVSAGPDVSDLNPSATIPLNGTVTDDGRPLGQLLTILWSKVEGPGTVNFADAASAITTATFTAPGTYVLKLEARDAQHVATPDTMVVRVGITGSVEPDGSLAAWWPANGEVHEVVHGNHDVEFLPRGPAFAPGEVGQGFTFNGSDHYGRVPAHADLDIGASAAGMTIEFWAKPADYRYGALVSWGTPGVQAGVEVWQHDGGPTLRVPINDVNGVNHEIAATNVFAPGVWVHVAVTYDRTTGMARLYKNGVLVAESNLGIFRPGTTRQLFFGRTRDGNNAYNGVLDEVSLYTKPLSMPEVQALHAAGVNGKAPLDDNLPPVVSAGPDVSDLNPSATIPLNGTVTDDGRPVGQPLTILWSKVEGPGTVGFADEASAATTATFSAPGTYVLKLAARDAQHVATPDTMVVRVGVTGSVEPDGSLAAWWPANGEVHEVVHGDHDVEFLPRGPAFATGEVGQGFTFNGSDHHGRVPAHADLDIGASAAGMTIEFWAKPADNRYASLVCWGTPGVQSGAEVWQHDGGPTLRAYLIDVNGTNHEIAAANVFAPGVWVHVAVTYDRITGMARLYKNGVLVAESNLGIFRPGTTRQLFFGRTRDGNNAYNGVLDEVSLYTKPLSMPEVQALHAAGVNGKAPLDDNLPPVVSAGADASDLNATATIPLNGTVTDDGRPVGYPLTIAWSKVEGPGTVNFADATAAATTATFTVAGTYVLKLEARDAQHVATPDTMVVRVGITGSVEPDGSLAAWWPANGEVHEVVHGNHDVEFLPRGPAFATGEVGQGFTFNGSDHHGRVPAHADLDIGASAAGMTIEFWAKPADNRYAMLVCWGTPGVQAGVEVWQHDGGPTLRVPILDVNGVNHEIAAANVFSPGVWVHVAVTYDRVTGLARLYKNGVLVAESTLGIFQPGTTRQLFFGRTRDGGNPYNGVLDEVSLYTKPLSLAEVQAIYNAGVSGKDPLAQNIYPSVLLDSPIPASSFVINTPITLGAVATDADGTVAKVEFFDGTTKLGEATAADAGQPNHYSFALPSGLPLGQHVLSARATDNSGAITPSSAATIFVVPVLPTVTLTAPAAGSTLATGVPLTFQATAAYTAGAISKVEFLDGPAKVGEATSPTSGSTYEFTLATGLTAGAHTLSARAVAVDGSIALSSTVNVIAQVVLPAVALTSPANGSTVVAGVPIALKATATTAQGTVTKVEFYSGTTLLGTSTLSSPNGSSSFTLTLTSGFSAGAHSLTAKATTSTGSSATSTPVGISAGAYTGAPDVLIVTPAEDSRISAPVPLTGVVAMAQLTSWAVDYRLKVADGETPNPWVQCATGSNLVGSPGSQTPNPGPQTPGPLGVFDPTSLLNGIYELQIHATNASNSTLTAPPITVVVEGNMKVGAFSLAFEDLSVPVAGIPITVTRTYDSRDSRVGDFGPGWRLAVANVRVQKNRNLGRDWYQTLQSGSGIQFYYVDPISQPIVTVTMPDGESHRFRGGADVKVRPNDPDNASFAVVADDGIYKFYPLGDTTSTLEPLDASGNLDAHFYIHGTGDQDLRTEDASDPFSPTYNPTRFRLTTKDGTKYLLDEKLGLLKLEDLNGNTLVLNRDPQNRVTTIVSQRVRPNPESQIPDPTTVTIHRDPTGRVDYIRDPAGHDLDYLYDAQGRLASFTNRESNITQFRYELSSVPSHPHFHYLTRVIDPRGIAALRSEYDASGKLVKQIDADGRETVFTHGVDAPARFEKIRDRLGKETTFFYDDRGNITTKIDALGAQTTYSYYPDSDWVKFETDHYGNTKSMAYDARGNVVVETVGASASEDPANPFTGYVTRTSYNDRSAPTQITDPSGRVQSFGYDSATNNLLTHTVGTGGSAPATTTYHYNADGTLDTVTDALGTVTATTYNYSYSNPAYPGAVKEITTQVSGLSSQVLRVTKSLYDNQDNMLATIATRTLPQGGTENIVTRYLYDTENRLKATIAPDGKVSETRYTSFGQTDKSILWQSLADYQSANLALARVTSYGYDNRGNQVSTTYPDGSSESSSFDLEGRREWSQDKLGQKTSFQYDDVGRLRFTILPDATPSNLTDNPYTETVYDLTGRVTDSYDELRHRTSVVYFPDGTPDAGRRKQSIQVLSTGNLITSYQYDASGNVRFVTDPRGNTVETQYDDQGRPTTVLYPATDENPATQSKTTYDILGRRIATTDQEGKVTRFRYDALGRLIEVRQYLDQSLAASDSAFSLPSSAVGIVSTRYTYDELGNQLTQTDARANTTSYRYDNLGRRTSRILPDNATEVLQYDGWGNLWKRTDFKGYTTTFFYDTMNRLTTKQADPSHPSLIYSHAPDKITYGYDIAGNRTDATVEKGSTVLYVEDTPIDERGRRQFKDTALGRLTYGYYTNSLLKSITSSNADGVKLAYRYDEANRLAYVDDSSQTQNPGSQTRTASYSYNANGSLQTVLYANSVQHAYGYDTLSRLRTLNVTKGASLHSYEYKLRASGHRQQIIENGTRTTTLAYDNLYRLTSETLSGDSHGNGGNVAYGLDKVGNRESRTSSVSSVPSVANTFNSRDWLSGDNYDANGNTLTSSQPPTLVTQPDVYDFEDHLIIRRKTDGTTVNLMYDADGILRQKTLLSASLSLVSATGYLTDTQNPTGYAQVMEERVNAASGITVKAYTYGSDLISRSTLAPGTTLPALCYYTYDGLGSVRELTNETGTITDTYDYDAFGILTYRAGTTDNAYLYRGERFESDIGQYYLRARFYNQATGRFWNQDTYEGSSSDPMSLHKYLYANADPVMHWDPSGNFTLVEASLIAATVGTIAIIAYPSITTGEEAQVEAHFDLLGQKGVFKYYHAYILLKGRGRPTYVFRAGPSFTPVPNINAIIEDSVGLVPNSAAMGYGDIVCNLGKGAEIFQPGAPDYPTKPTDDLAHAVVPNVRNDPYFLVLAKLKEVCKKIDGLHIQYHPASQNSNSAACTFIIHADLYRITPPVSAPGWDLPLY